MIDQGFVSAGNFLTVNFLARWLRPEAEFGLFSVMLETMLYLNSLQAALVIYPLSVRGARSDKGGLGVLSSGSMILTLLLLPVLGLAMGGVAGLTSGGMTIVTAIAAITLWQLQETTRRALMADMRFGDAIWGDALRYLGQAGMIWAFHAAGILSLNTAYLAIGLSSAVGTILQAIQIGLKPVYGCDLRNMSKEFWVLGRWMLLNNAGGAISGLAYWYVLKWVHGDPACAAFGVIVGLMKLANPIMVSIGNLIVPAVARLQEHEGIRAARRIAWRYTAFGAGLLSLLFIPCLILPDLMLRLFYGWKTPYVEHAFELRLYVLNYAMAYVAAALGSWQAGLGHSRLSFYAQVVNVVVTLAVGLPMTYAWGVIGLVLGSMLAITATALATAYYMVVLFRKQQA
jgi:O-antigen/teichoic acid export membrane protein